MYAMKTSCDKTYAALLFAIVCISSVFAAPCPICSKCEGQAFHDAQVTKGGRCKTGTIPRGCVPSLNKSDDYCIQCLVTVHYNTPSGYRRCPKCYGKGEIPDKIESPKEESKTTKSTDTNPAQEAKGNTSSSDQTVILVGVKKCDKCDEKGKIGPTIDCNLCENGFNHKKDGDSYKCRACGKACNSRFAPCCKPDCPECGNKREVKIDCPYCGGDKTITPLEETRNKERMAPMTAKQ
jgi:hypothetical protein